MKCLNICFFINLFVCFAVNGQQLAIPITSKKTSDSSKTLFLPISGQTLFSFPNAISLGRYTTPPPSFYTNSLSFFCKKELQIERAIKFPVKMRLGSVTYTDKMEGKITARGAE